MVLFTMTNLMSAADDVVSNVVLGIHGGIGVDKVDMTPDLDKQVRAVLTEALQAGHAKLKSGGSSLDAVETAIRVMEDSPLLNAGKGAVFTHEGRNELDGQTKQAGSMAGVTIIKNPITGARAVMEKSKHVMLVGRGAEIFATQQGLDIVDPSYFWTEHRWKAIQAIWKQEAELKNKRGALPVENLPPAKKSEYGTVANEHFARGFVGKGQEQDSFRRYALAYEVGDAMDEGSGFAGSGGRQYEEWPV